MFTWMLLGLGAVVALYIVLGVYLGMVLKWEDEQTVGLGYYGRSPEDREAFKRTLRAHARLLAPLLWLNARLIRFDFRKVSFRHGDVAAPHGSCSPESFARAQAYRPRPEDIFVVTQMKCGTTWMQHVVYEVLQRGAGDLAASGTPLYAIAPWLEGRKSVPVEQAPLIGRERPSRIIKTHLPAALCPVSPGARFIYVARHPVSCFASCIDFVETNVGRMAPPVSAFEEWYCSPALMWWGTWPAHVSGWHARAAGQPNVLFVYFEDMKRDLGGVVRQVADFLGLQALTDAELGRVVEKCSFAYMQQHQTLFEMHPPHILQTSAQLFVRGSADRHRDVPAEVRGRLTAWCTRQLAGSSFPLARVYPDVVAAAAS